jgi:hypothetical protein
MNKTMSVKDEDLICFSGEFEVYVLDHIINLFEKLVDDNDKIGRVPLITSVFQSIKSPNISPTTYIKRINEFCMQSPAAQVITLIYIRRIIDIKGHDLDITSLTFHRLYLTFSMIASKFIDDSYYSNARWAKVGGIGIKELNCLEIEALFLCGFRFFVSCDEYSLYMKKLTAHEELYASSTLN